MLQLVRKNLIAHCIQQTDNHLTIDFRGHAEKQFLSCFIITTTDTTTIATVTSLRLLLTLPFSFLYLYYTCYQLIVSTRATIIGIITPYSNLKAARLSSFRSPPVEASPVLTPAASETPRGSSGSVSIILRCALIVVRIVRIAIIPIIVQK